MLKSVDSEGSTKSRRGYDFRRVDSLLFHIHRTCQRPLLPPEIRTELARRLSTARLNVSRRASIEEVSQPLQEMQHYLDTRGTELSQRVQEELRVVHKAMRSAAQQDYNTKLSQFLINPTTRDINSDKVKKRLNNAQKLLAQLKELNEVKMDIQRTAGMVQKGGTFTKEEVHKIIDELGRNVNKLDLLERSLKIVKEAETKRDLPQELQNDLRVSMSRTRRVLMSYSGCILLEVHLKKLGTALAKRKLAAISRCLEELNTSIDHFDKLQSEST